MTAMQPGYELNLDTGRYEYSVTVKNMQTGLVVGVFYFVTLDKALDYCEWVNKH